jgi:hypothetical protein
VREIVELQKEVDSDLKTKAYTIWAEISQILAIK